MQQSNYCIDEHAPEINYICARAYVLFVAIVIIAAKNSLSPSGTLGKHKKCVVWRSEELNVATTTTAAKKKTAVRKLPQQKRNYYVRAVQLPARVRVSVV